MNVSASNNFNKINYGAVASGKQINSAADNASGLAIVQKMLRERNGLDVGTSNARDGMSALNVADGALGGIQDSLQRIHELGVKSMNGLLSDDDKAMYQVEIDQLKDGIQSLAKDTSFNEMTLLDGSMADMHLATNPNGGGPDIQMADSTLEALGIADFDVTEDFDLSVIEDAMSKVSEARSNLGASTNGLEHTINNNNVASWNQTSSMSRIEDLDVPKAISDIKKDELLNDYKSIMMKKQMEEGSIVTKMFQ